MLKEKTLRQQQKLASFCRTNILDDDLLVRKDRVHHYRRLVFNIILDMMETMYPISMKLFPEGEWEQLIHRFFANYKCTDPQVWKMPRFLSDYIKTGEKEILVRYPFLPDLLVMEWKELEWFTNEDLEWAEINSDISSSEKRICFYFPEHELLILDYPVYRKEGPDFWKSNPGKYFLLVYRHPESRKVFYQEVDALSCFVWESIKEGKNKAVIISELNDLLIQQKLNNRFKAEFIFEKVWDDFLKLRLLKIQ
ncbi:MAG: DNA-binding domain-containing protein [Bacteroidia bacterium]|nr:DNA-binding domain-containing protein [Bacteroidia bacterium]